MPDTSKSLPLGQEYAAPGEQALIQQIERGVTQKLERTYPPSVRPARRDAHPKTHGCVRAEFTVLDDPPEMLRYGVFQTPRTFVAWIRFSSGKPEMHPDTEPDVQGMAIKLMGVEGEKLLESEKEETTQDFVMANSPAYFIRNLEDYTAFNAVFTKDRPGFLMKIAVLVHFLLRWDLEELGTLKRATSQDVPNPLQIPYWSQTPYKLGPHAIKFSARPAASARSWKPEPPGPDYMQEAMTNQLQNEEVIFDFLVQVQADPVKMPVEDALVVWDEAVSPYRKVAAIRIPKQTFASPEQMEFAENLSFTPWHSLPDHQPLGGINRARRTVYEAISRLRHQMNSAPRREPTGEEIFPGAGKKE